jgi:hypothetical protein
MGERTLLSHAPTAQELLESAGERWGAMEGRQRSSEARRVERETPSYGSEPCVNRYVPMTHAPIKDRFEFDKVVIYES